MDDRLSALKWCAGLPTRLTVDLHYIGGFLSSERSGDRGAG
jgi:hypothetical protein